MNLPHDTSDDRQLPAETPVEPAETPFEAAVSTQDAAVLRQAELTAAMQFFSFAMGAAENYDPSQPDHGRSSVRAALVGVIHLIAGLFPNKAALPVSLNHLLYALYDLDQGKIAPLLQPTKVAHRPGTALADDLFKALPSAAVTKLIEDRQISLELAGRSIARTLKKMGYRPPAGGEITGKQVLKWRERMMTESPRENRAAAQYQFALQQVQTMERQQAVDFLMDCMPQLYPPQNPKKLPT